MINYVFSSVDITYAKCPLAKAIICESISCVNNFVTLGRKANPINSMHRKPINANLSFSDKLMTENPDEPGVHEQKHHISPYNKNLVVYFI